MTLENFSDAHQAAVVSESAIMGGTNRTQTGSFDIGADLGVEYEDENGSTIRSFRFEMDIFGTPRSQP